MVEAYTATEAFVGALEMAFDSAELPTTLVTLYRISAMFANAPNPLPNLGDRARRGLKTIFPPAHIRRGLSGAPELCRDEHGIAAQHVMIQAGADYAYARARRFRSLALPNSWRQVLPCAMSLARSPWE